MHELRREVSAKPSLVVYVCAARAVWSAIRPGSLEQRRRKASAAALGIVLFSLNIRIRNNRINSFPSLILD